MVNKDRLYTVLAQPEQVHADDLPSLDHVIESYPYFQAARSVRLKCLHNNSSSLYNKELQATAAHTADRSVLFDFITSEEFLQNRISEQIKKRQDHLESIEVDAEEIEIESTDLNADTDFTQVIDVDLFQKKESIVDQPLTFYSNEKYSFTEWLRLTQLKPIDRTEEKKKSSAGQKATKPVDTSKKLRQRQMEKIDQFLADKPKIKPRKSSTSDTPLQLSNDNSKQLMTETLAQVYLAQKNYEKAIKSYEILILQHPEKSGFFADRIQEIKNLQSNT
ncbi:hypothetical protein [Nonlabens ponticola]|uniref:Tetratricopeptide repeat protein n=1 Tax=Nonlabens ponticola TaxID=2496866 RepID=A0A3S9MUA0_9FLAO|nr:hypothetical protein [Nonlabens ponticola]AZQ42733.1 hypothetical protein EJ995_00190 [Nonlabens ponticola]